MESLPPLAVRCPLVAADGIADFAAARWAEVRELPQCRLTPILDVSYRGFRLAPVLFVVTRQGKKRLLVRDEP